MRQLFSSKKFIVMIAAIVVAIAGKLGLNLDPDLVQQIVYLAMAYIVGQGIADHGKEAAKVEAASAVPVTTTTIETSSTQDDGLPPTTLTRTTETTIKPAQAGFADMALMLAISMILCIVMVMEGCHLAKHEASVAKDAAVDCLASRAQALTKEFGPAVKSVMLDAFDPSTREINWSPIKSITGSFAKDSGMCVLANTVADMLDPPPATEGAPLSAPVDMDPRSLRSGFAEITGGTRYATRKGLL